MACSEGDLLFQQNKAGIGEGQDEKWYPGNWRFRIVVLRVGKENRAEESRLGLEPGDTFECTYGCPADFCPTSFIKIFPALEVVRCGGDLRSLGGTGLQEIEVLCPDGVVLFRLTGEALAPYAEGGTLEK